MAFLWTFCKYQNYSLRRLSRTFESADHNLPLNLICESFSSLFVSNIKKLIIRPVPEREECISSYYDDRIFLYKVKKKIIKIADSGTELLALQRFWNRAFSSSK